MTRTTTLLTLVVAAALAGCDNSDHTIVAGGPPDDPTANAAEQNAPVALPPSIVGSHQYRCKDNSLVSIDWLSDGTKNSARVTAGGAGKTLVQAEAAGPYSGEGATLTGDPKATSVTYNGQSCKR